MGTEVWLALAVAVLGAAAVAAGLFARRVEARSDPATAYLAEVVDPSAAVAERDVDEFAQRLARPFVERILRPLGNRLVSAVGSVTPSDHRVRVRTRLAQAGVDGGVRPEEVIAAQGAGFLLGLGLGVAVLLSGAVSPVTGMVVLLLLVGAGTAAPMAWLSHRVDARTEGVRQDLPETLDLLAISVEAGLGLEGAMEVVVEKAPGPLGEELARTLQEMELGLSRRDALNNLKQRSQVPELSAFVQALVQADILGMPLARVLKIQANEMRVKRRQWAREKAGKLPVKILFPLVGCIFPAILVIILGPAVGQIGQAF